MLIGNVGKDPEIRYLEGGNPGGAAAKVATFPLATSEKYRDRNGEQRENTEWHNIVVWRALADTTEKFVKKGTQLYIEGRLRTRTWTDQTGNKRYTTEIIADVLQLLGKRSDNPASAPGGYSSPYQNYQAPSQPSSFTPKPQQYPAQPAPQQEPVDFTDNAAADDLPF